MDHGRMVGTGLNEWVAFTTEGTIDAGETVAIGITHGGPAGGDPTDIGFLAAAVWDTVANAPDAPSDWPEPTFETSGPGVVYLADGSTGFDVDDPADAPPATIGAGTEVRPGAIEGIRLRFRVAGIVAA